MSGFTLFTRLDESGEARRTWLEPHPDGARLRDDEAGLDVVLPESLITQIFERYARELDPDIEPDGASFTLPSGARIIQLHYRLQGRFANDDLGRDFLVLQRQGAAPIAELAPSITAPLRFIASRHAR